MSALRSTLFAFVVLLSTGTSAAFAAPFITNDSPVRVFIPSDDSLGLAWTGSNEPFDDSGWILGVQGVGFDFLPDYLPMIQTDVRASMYGQSSTAFIRLPFVVESPERLASLSLSIDYDDGFAAYLNGVEVARENAPAGVLTWQSQSPIALGVGTEPGLLEYDLTAYLPHLREGENVLAFYGINNGVGESSDFLIRARLDATEAVPEPAAFSMALVGIFALIAASKRRGSISDR